jgi:hypothetical protein
MNLRNSFQRVVPMFLSVMFIAITTMSPSHFTATPIIPSTYTTTLPIQHILKQEYAVTPSLEQFVNAVVNGKKDTAVGIFVPGVLALPIVQQPLDQPYFVSTDASVVTQFRLAMAQNTIGLLAHNDLAGAMFSDLDVAQHAYVVYGSGAIQEFLISTIKRYQALDPESPFSSFVDLDTNGTPLSSSTVFNNIFSTGNQLIFQTCIAKDGEGSWGRMFVIATHVQ